MALIIAHRTCPRDAPENSLAGVRTAAALGADAVEVDVRLTRDRVAVLIHDPLGLRTAWWPLPISRCSASWVTRWRLRGSATETVPTLEQALAVARDNDLRVAIDTKAADAAPIVLDVARRTGMAQQVLLWSQHTDALRHYAAHGDGAEVALLRDALTDDAEEAMLADAHALGVSAVSVHQSRLRPELIERCHGAGLRVHCWFQDEQSQHQKAGFDVDGIVTDWPQAARRVRGDDPRQ